MVHIEFNHDECDKEVAKIWKCWNCTTSILLLNTLVKPSIHTRHFESHKFRTYQLLFRVSLLQQPNAIVTVKWSIFYCEMKWSFLSNTFIMILLVCKIQLKISTRLNVISRSVVVDYQYINHRWNFCYTLRVERLFLPLFIIQQKISRHKIWTINHWQLLAVCCM